MTSSTSKFVLIPPDQQTAEGWLSQWDNKPSLLPTWPQSNHMTLVAVTSEGYGRPDDGSDSMAYVLTKPADADRFISFDESKSGAVTLFFTVAKSRVIPCCTGLTLEAWVNPVD